MSGSTSSVEESRAPWSSLRVVLVAFGAHAHRGRFCIRSSPRIPAFASTGARLTSIADFLLFTGQETTRPRALLPLAC
jgi:hypothetical protein